jgi:hypothetical protein
VRSCGHLVQDLLPLFFCLLCALMEAAEAVEGPVSTSWGPSTLAIWSCVIHTRHQALNEDQHPALYLVPQT